VRFHRRTAAARRKTARRHAEYRCHFDTPTAAGAPLPVLPADNESRCVASFWGALCALGLGRLQKASTQSAVLDQVAISRAAGESEARESSLSRIARHPAAESALLTLAALILLVVGIGRPATMYYDEGYWLPEARAFVQGTPNPHPIVSPLVRPPLGKLMVAAGMELAGDNAFGWRIAGAVCGALTVGGVYLWTYLLLFDRRLALLAGGLTLLDNFVFVMSRIAMLDIFFVFYLVWSLVAFTAAVSLKTGAAARRGLLIGSGILIGLAGACKWNAIDTLGAYFLVGAALLWLAYRPSSEIESPLRRYAGNIRQIGAPTLLLGLSAVPLAAYALTYWPMCRLLRQPFGIRSLVAMNFAVWHFSVTEVSNKFLVTPWYQWPFSLKPQMGLSYLVANPVVAWGGIAALLVCLWSFLKRRELAEGFVILLFAANFLQWVVTPEKGLLYYYYFPCVVILGAAIAVALRNLPARFLGIRVSLAILACAFLVFLWCYPRMAHLDAPWDCVFGCWS